MKKWLLSGWIVCTFNAEASSIAYSLTDANTSSPTVIFQSGFGDDRSVWNGVTDRLKGSSTLFTYDRPGMGESLPIDNSRSPCAIASELHTLLESSGVKPPYILVGHSLGGLYQYVYAKMYPDEVSGMVLIDPTHPKHLETLKKTMPAMANFISVLQSTGIGGKMQKREFESQTECLDTLSIESPISVPTKFLFSGRPDTGANDEFVQEQNKLRLDWQQKIQPSTATTVWHSGHYIQKEQPLLVTNTILELLALEKLETVDEQPFTFKGHSSSDIHPSQTTKKEIVNLFGAPKETLQKDKGGEVLVYDDKYPKASLGLGFVPIVGDILEGLEILSKMQTFHELIIETDERGAVVHYHLRALK